MAEIVTVVVGVVVPLIGLAQGWIAYKQKQATELARQQKELAKQTEVLARETKATTEETHHAVNHRMDELLATVKKLAQLQGIEEGREQGRVTEAERRAATAEPPKGGAAGIAAEVVQVETMTVENLEVAGEKPKPVEKKE